MKLLTKSIIDQFKKQGDTSEKETDQIMVICKLFNPAGAATWWLYEHVEDSIYRCFATMGDSQLAECGTVCIDQLAELCLPFGLKIERDLHWKACPLSEVITEVKGQ